MNIFETINICSLLAFPEWCEAFPDDPEFKKPALLAKLVAEGKHGRKAKHGFYKYD